MCECVCECVCVFVCVSETETEREKVCAHSCARVYVGVYMLETCDVAPCLVVVFYLRVCERKCESASVCVCVCVYLYELSRACVRVRVYVGLCNPSLPDSLLSLSLSLSGVATISRLLKMIGLFCRISSLL